MKLEKLTQLLGQKGVKLGCRDTSTNEWMEWTPDNEYTDYIYLEQNEKRILLRPCRTLRLME